MEIKLLTLLRKEERDKIKALLFSKKSILFQEGSICNEVGILVSGEGRICSYLPNGKTIVYKKLLPGDVFGNNLIFSSENFYRGDVEININSTVVLINKVNLLYLLKNNDNFLEEYLRIQSDFGKELNAKIKVLSCDKCVDKVINDITISGGMKIINSITSWAEEICESRENLSRCLSKMLASKQIKKVGKTYSLINLIN